MLVPIYSIGPFILQFLSTEDSVTLVYLHVHNIWDCCMTCMTGDQCFSEDLQKTLHRFTLTTTDLLISFVAQ